MNFDFATLKDSIERIEDKLSLLLRNMEYEDYVNFIKTNEKLRDFDNTLALYQNNIIYTESMMNSLPEDYISEIDNIVLDKVKELHLEDQLPTYNE